MKVLISGGAGFIGSVLSYKLHDEKIDYAVIDNLCTSYKKNLPRDTIFYQGNINNEALLQRILNEFGPTHIVHLAASLNVSESELNKKKYYINNIKNSKIFLNFFIRNDIKNYIFASTAAVYKKNSSSKKVEDKNLTPSNYYGKTKLIIEKYLLNHKKNFNLNLKILRFFNVVGADHKLRSGSLSKKANQLFNCLSMSIETRKTFYIYGNNLKTKDGTCVRDYVDVIDLVKVIVLFIKNRKVYKYNTFNIGTNKGHSVLDVINLFNKVLNKNITYLFLNKRKGDPTHSVCSNLRLKKIYKFKFSPLKDSIKRHYYFYKKISN